MRGLLGLAVCACILAGPSLRAQPPATPATPAEPPAAKPDKPATPPVAGAQEVKPETYYLKDADGRLVPVPNMSYEEFDRLLQLEVGSKDASSTLPSFTLQELLISGTADRQRADLAATLSVRLHRDGWVRVPIRFAEAIIREPPKYEGTGEVFVSSDKDGPGYVCWLRASQGQLHQISLKLSAIVQEVGDELRLALPVPRATLSELDLRVTVPQASATVNSGLLEVKPAGTETQFLVKGLASDFQIAWSKGDAAPAESRPLLRADIRTLVKVEGVREVSGEVTLNLTSLRGEFDAFNVRLPPGIQLFPRQPTQNQYRVTETTAAEGTQDTLVQIKLERPTTGPVAVQLSTEFTPTINGKSAEFEVGGLEVENAFRQSEVVDFYVKGDLAVTWRPGPNVQRTVVREDVKNTIAASFESLRRGYSLRVQVSPQEPQINVEPVYVLHVEPQRIRLTATLKYRVRGVTAYGTNLYVTNWRVTKVLPETLVDNAQIDLTKRDPLFVPLLPLALPDTGEFTLGLEAEQDIPDTGPDNRSVTLALPRLEGRTLAPAVVAVVPADNVEVIITDSDLEGLERDPSPPKFDLPVRQQSPVFLRERSDAKGATLVASVRRRARAVSVGSACQVRLDQQMVRVRQTFDYRVAYEPLRNIALTLPRNLLENGTLRILDEQQALPFFAAPVAPAAPAAPADATAVVQVDLLTERIGGFQVLVQHESKLVDLLARDAGAMRIPLAVPVPASDTVQTTSRLEIETGAEFRAQVQGPDWEPAEPQDRPDQPPQWISRSRPTAADIALDRLEPRASSSVTILKAWIQSWLGDELRRDRAAFRVLTGSTELVAHLPASTRLEQVLLDGHAVQARRETSGTVVVSLPKTETPREFVLELWYSAALPRRLMKTRDLLLRPPTLANSTWTQRLYWEFVTPAQDHLVWPPRGLTAEMTWQPRGLYFGRVPTLRQEDLERWIGASRQDAFSPTLNRYLFSSFGVQGPVRAAWASRTAILLTISGAALLAGLALMYGRGLRHPVLLFLSGLAMLTVIFLAPDLALAVVQTASLGIVLVLGAWGLKLLVDWRQARTTLVRGSTAASPDSKTVKAALSFSVASAHPPTTTATAPGPAPIPAGEPAS